MDDRVILEAVARADMWVCETWRMVCLAVGLIALALLCSITARR